MMATMIGNSTDVVGFLKEQHQQIKALFGTVATSSGKAREEAFYQLRRLLAVHETAEEEIVHPAARRALPDGESVVAARLDEENEAKHILARLENLDVGSAEFGALFSQLRAAVVAHAEAEETREFDRLGDEMEPERLERMKKAVILAEKIAPTRPHPGVESAVANVLAGPFASMIDRARDALSGKS
jgi:hemerythrin superfamily protein